MQEIFCSTIIPTVGRKSLTQAVCSVLDQGSECATVEVIVVNDSGQPLPPMAWQQSPQVQILQTNRRERCVARNAGAAIAQGKYLHFLDDDDLLLPGALDTFWRLDQEMATLDDLVWLYGAYQNVDNEGNVIQEICPGIHGNIFNYLVASEGIPLQASLVNARYFHTVGAFDPSPAVLGVEDRDVGRRLALIGSVAYTATFVARIRIGQLGSTTDWSRIAEGDRWGREKALIARGAYQRLLAAATSGYWHGRVSRAYFASMVWNLQRKNLLIATSRALAGCTFAGRHPLSASFWRGLRTKIQ